MKESHLYIFSVKKLCWNCQGSFKSEPQTVNSEGCQGPIGPHSARASSSLCVMWSRFSMWNREEILTLGLQEDEDVLLLVSLQTSFSHTDVAPSAHRLFTIMGASTQCSSFFAHYSWGAFCRPFVGNSQICFQVKFTQASLPLLPAVCCTFLLDCLIIPYI